MQVTELSWVTLATIAVGFFIPVLVGVLSKVSWHPAVKAIIHMGLTAIVGVLTGFINTAPGETFDWAVAITNGVLAWLMGVAGYFSLWKPSGVTERAQTVGVKDKPAYDVNALPDRHEAESGVPDPTQ